MDILTYGLLNKKVEEAKNVSGEKITEAVNAYLDENPPTTGATAEQATQIDKNVADIGELKSDLTNYDYDVKRIDNVIVGSKSVNRYPTQDTSIVGNGLLRNGLIEENTEYSHTDYIKVEPNKTYILGLVPFYGKAKSPYFGCPVGIELYTWDKTFIQDVTPADGIFKTPLSARFIRFNFRPSTGLGIGIINGRTMLVEGENLPSSWSEYSETKTIKDDIVDLTSKLEKISDATMFISTNLYDSSLQTEETIDKHYYVNGIPYSTTEYDDYYHCTALIPVEPNTQYAIGLVPSLNGYTAPWGDASNGLFFYDDNGNYISKTKTTVFTTPYNAKYIRFNYNIGANIFLNIEELNARCMLVKGDTLPTEYEEFVFSTIKEKLLEVESRLDNVSKHSKIKYIISSDGLGITLISKYNSTHDIVIVLKCKGGNSLFDFYRVGIIPNTKKEISDSISGITYLIEASGDWHAPFVVKAKNNADGDNPDSTDFTGGNHQYNNSGSGSTPTARTISLSFLIDNMKVENGSGECDIVEMVWSNLVQGANTKKSDGTGREVLKEVHRMIFDGIKFDSFVDLIPLEDIYMERWYGFQWFTNSYKYIRYIGANNRGEYDATLNSTSCGDNKCCHVKSYSDNHMIMIDIDKNYDLGDHSLLASDKSAIFTETYGKGYCYIISDTDMNSDLMYSLHGAYTFKSLQN